MTAEARRVLSVAARSGRLGCVLLDRGRLEGWTTSERGAQTATAAATRLQGWIASFEPDVLVSENPDASCRKGGRQRAILHAFAATGDELPLLNIVVQRRRRFENFYLEAADLVRRFPQLEPDLPVKPPIWKKEPYRLVIFEALALVRDAGLIGEDDAENAASPGR